MFRRLTIPALLVAAAIATTGCGRVVINNSSTTLTIGSAPYTEGSGTVTTETRPLADFSGVSVENGMTVSLRRGAAPAAEVTADDNLVDLIATDVRDGTLHVRVTGSLTTHHPIELDVTIAAAVESIGIDGGSTVDVEDVSGPTLSASVAGGSTLRAGGRSTALQLHVESGSTADLRNLEAMTAEVAVETGSTAIVNASDVVTGSCHTGSTLKVGGGADYRGVDTDAGSTAARN